MRTFKNGFIVLALGLVFGSCKENSTGNSGSNISMDYIATNNSVYFYTSYIIDSLGQKILSYKDTIRINIYPENTKIGEYSNSLRLESSSHLVDGNGTAFGPRHAKNWYAQSFDTVYAIAEAGEQTSFFLKSAGINIKNAVFNFNNPISGFPFHRVQNTTMDSIRLSETKSVVYALPFSINKEWQCFPDGWVIHRKKKVENIESISTPAGTFSCYKMRTSLTSRDFLPEDLWYDYVSREGLILRTMKIEVQISTEQNPDGAGRATYYSRLELVSIK
jgi:hypothetical protein